MKLRQWLLVLALVATLAATWWASRIEEPGGLEVVAPVARPARPAAAAPARAAAGATVQADAGALAIVREPWPASAASLLQLPSAAQAQAGVPPPAALAAGPPPLPFTFIGSIERGGRRVVMLMEGDRLHLVAARERIGEQYRVERVTSARIEFTYLPLQQRQVLDIGQDR